MANPVLPSSGVLSPLGLDAVRLSPGFWGDRVALNREVTIAHCQEWEEREGWIGNFRGERPRRGREFSDSEIYKLLEAMAWADHPGLPALAETVAQAQEGDGYLNTRWSGSRYTDFEWGHELYCYGHLIQAGVARLRMHGEDRLTQVAVRAADHVCRRFMDGTQTCGHPVIEMALVELYRATGTERYLEMARRFVERRGLPALADIPFGRAYYQDDVPIRQAQVFRGHVVRALYLASGVVDVAVETGDQELLKAVESQWERTVARRTHLTGGMGSRHADESYGEDYELPPDQAYNETCASIASVMLAHRLLLATGDVRYADLAERTLYNMLATGVALDGCSFFYANPLRVRVPAVPLEGVNHAAEGGLRSPWFDVSCCPNNIARTLASLPAYVATASADGIRIHQHTPSEIRHGGLAVRVETGYPWAGSVTVRVLADGEGRIGLRVPAWATDATLARVPAAASDSAVAGTSVRGRASALDAALEAPTGPTPVRPGYAHADGPWRAGDELRLELPMAPRWTFPDRRIDALRGSAAVERGPLVYCAESVADEPPLGDLTARVRPPVEHEVDDVVELEVEAELGSGDGGWPYASQPDERPSGTDVRLRLVPYHRWGNRGPATMRVWLPI
ncbi:glycoside hydrolase family 127 protein [Nonomuraea sp. K274]|uniref:Glycoside hydrolase family 127 protein n=1 Tax=Nonomuraea cypriaca TaxID=1187855 RepID=A0A931AFN4_9ACTN|nr:beta-L-arabinofuranosidase domain-containing protein [Nonomuraea cypriaca]MBF8189265.1 glycoside hydrolase family 127 protein [Nonomuraea cypriaca]